MLLLNSLITLILLITAAYVVQQRYTRASRKSLLAKFPLLEAYGMDFLSVTHKGYIDYLRHGKPYRLRTSPAGDDDRIMLPFKYIDEVKSSSETTGLSFLLFSDQAILLQYSKGPCQTPACTYAVKQFLNRSLTNMTPTIHSGVMADIANALGQKIDWTTTVLYPTMLSIIARNAARVLADPQLCDNEEWIQIAINITMQTFQAATSIRQKLNPAWYWLAPYLDQPTKDILRCRRRAAQIIKPIYAARKLEVKSEGENPSQQSTGMTWLLSAPGGERDPSDQQVADDLLFLSIAGIHTTTASLMIAIHDLISHPDVLKDLREEIDEAYPEEGAWKASELAALPRLDSFMKESQRIHPMGMITMSRAPCTNFKFEDGLEIPAHTLTGMSSQELNMDPQVFHEPEIFDARRFMKLRESTGLSKYTFAAAAEDITINFGAGQHACPGRALAGTTIKIILAELIRKYDMRFENVDQPPAMFATALGRSVDPGASYMIRKTTLSV